MSAPAMSGRRVTVLGTGIMGGPMARHLASGGHTVTAWDVSAAALEQLADVGISVRASAEDAVDRAEVLITMLPDAETTEAVMRDLPIGDAQLWVQSATVGIDGTERLLSLAAEADVAMVDCPLLGTRASAEAGQLVALASGPPELTEPCRDLLSAYCHRVMWLGPAGEGSRLKLVMNNWVIGLTALTAETVALAQGLGFEASTFLELIAGGPLDVDQAQLKGALMLRNDFTPALPLRLAAKDARLIRAAARQAGLDLPLNDAVVRAYSDAEAFGLGDLDMSAVFVSLMAGMAGA